MPSLLCDATTAAGTHCKNTAIGAVNGRNFCFVPAHRKQVEAQGTAAEAPSSASTGPSGFDKAAWDRAHGIVK